MKCIGIIFGLIFSINPSIIVAVSGKLNDHTGKYIQFNSYHDQLNADFPVWYGALKESTLIALGGDLKLRKSIQRAPYYGYVKSNKTFGDIVTLAKGKFRKISEDDFAFQQTNDSEDEASSQNILALFMVEKIRHHVLQNSGYRFDLRFTIIPITLKLNQTARSLSDISKRVFILRDIDYPEYFSAPNQNLKIQMRSDVFPMLPHYHKMNPHVLNLGEYQKNSVTFPSTQRNYQLKSHVVHHQNYNRLPIRFPDSHEAPSKHVVHVRHKNPHEIYKLDHRGAAAPEINDINLRSGYYQPSIAVPMIAIPQMSLIPVPYTVPIQFQVPFSTNQRSHSTFSKNHPKKFLHNENVGVNSNRIQKFSLPDQKLNEISTSKPESKVSVKYSVKFHENMDFNNDFKPIIPPFQYMSRARGKTSTSTTTTTSTTQAPLTTALTEKPRSHKRNETRKFPKRYPTTTESPPETTSFEIIATRASLINSTTERPVLKWYPKKTRTKLSQPATTLPTLIETTMPIIQTKNNSSSRSLLFRGRNRYLLSNREKNFRNLTTALSSQKWKAITTTESSMTLPIETTRFLPNYAETTRENESTVTKSPFEFISANVEVIGNTSNIDIYKAELDHQDDFLKTTVESTTISVE